MGVMDRFRQATQEMQRRYPDAAHHGRAMAKEARARATAAIEQTVDRIREAQPEQVGRAEAALSTVSGTARANLGGFAEGRTRVESWIGESRTGRAVGSAVQRAGNRIAQVPVLSLVQDSMDAKHGIKALTEIVRSEPDHMYGFLWLGEALRARERDMAFVAAARTAVNPTSLVTREALKSMARAGNPQSTRTPAERILRRAFALAARRVERDNRDGDAYHVIARYYLAAGKAAGGLKAGKAAVALAPPELRGHTLYTLARIYRAIDDPQAPKAAQAAVNQGFSLGNEILADLLYESGNTPNAAERRRVFITLKNRVNPADIAAYSGIFPAADAKARHVMDSQLAKSRQLWDSLWSRRNQAPSPGQASQSQAAEADATDRREFVIPPTTQPWAA